MQSAELMCGGLLVMISWFGWSKQKQEKQYEEMVDDPTAALAEIGVLGLDGSGTIVFCNNRMLQILEEAIGRQITHKRVINLPLADVVELPLSKTLIGHSLIWREELNGRRVSVGDSNLSVSTLLLWGVGRQTLLGCIGYYIPYTPEPAGEHVDSARYAVERLARERGYPGTNWVSGISLEHALQLQQCLARNTHTIPNSRHCAFAKECAFNPVYGYFSLERRRFYRVPVRIPLRVFVEASANGKNVDEPLASKFCEGQAMNLSLGGICLQSVIKFPIGVILRLDFLLPTSFQSQGQVVWNRRAANGQWEHGIRFIALEKEERAVILRLLSSRVPASECAETDNSAQGALVGDIVVIRAVALILRFLKAKDRDTFVHSLRTAAVAKAIGGALGLPAKELRLLRYAAALHDLGKLEIEPGLLKSTTRLRPKQIRALRAHAVYGARLVESYPPLRTLSAIVRHHHERFDGLGYPDGLAGEDIPFLSRIIAVADSIDAMAHPRPYRPRPLNRQQIFNVLEREAGHQFDPKIARAAMELLPGRKLVWGWHFGQIESENGVDLRR